MKKKKVMFRRQYKKWILKKNEHDVILKKDVK